MLPGLGRAVDQRRGAGGTWGGRELFLIIFNGFSGSGRLESLWKLSGCSPSIKCPHPEGFPGLLGAEAHLVPADPTVHITDGMKAQERSRARL